MQILTDITNDPKQKYTVVTSEGDQFTLRLTYKPTQQLWFYGIEYQETIINGACLLCGFNILRQWQNILPFGISVRSTDAGDPYFIDDFVNGRISFYILSRAEVREVESVIYG